MTRETDNESFARHVQRWLGVSPDGWAGKNTVEAFDRRVGLEIPEADSPPVGPHVLSGPAQFFAIVRGHHGALLTSQVEGFNVLLRAMNQWPLSWAAYGLATAWHETAKTMQPIKERGGDSYFKRMYDITGDRPHVARDLGNADPGDGVLYAGRGYVQLTGRNNYRKFGIVDSPDRAMEPEVAASIMVTGMEKGIFTGKKMSNYLPGDYVNARRIINGTDKAQEIARIAAQFEQALKAGGWA